MGGGWKIFDRDIYVSRNYESFKDPNTDRVKNKSLNTNGSVGCSQRE